MLILTFCSLLQLVNSMKLVFDTFIDNVLTANHSFNLSSSLLTSILSWTMSLPEQKIVLSSTKRMSFNTSDAIIACFPSKPELSINFTLAGYSASLHPPPPLLPCLPPSPFFPPSPLPPVRP